MRKVKKTVIFLVAIILTVQPGKCHVGFKSESEQFEHFSCTIYSNSIESSVFECSVSFEHEKDIVIPDCVLESNNAVVSVGTTRVSPSVALHNATFTCTANFPLSSRTFFRDGDPKVQYIKIIPEKTNQNPFYKYKLSILFPTYPQYNYLEGDLVKYNIFNVGDPSDELNVFIELYSLVGSTKGCRTYKLNEATIVVDPENEIVTIPCVNLDNSSGNNKIVQLHNEKGHLPVDNSTVFYDKLRGFLLNKTNFKYIIPGNYVCELKGCANKIFHLINHDCESSPEDDVYLYDQKFNVQLGTTGHSGVTLACNQWHKSIKIKTTHSNTNTTKPSLNVPFKTYSIGVSPTRHFATAQVPYLNESQRDAVGGWSNFQSNIMQFECQNDFQTNDKQIWRVHYDSVDIPFYYSHEYNAFICEGHPHTGEGHFLSFSHWSCNNIAQCAIVQAYCFQNNDKNISKDNMCLRYLQKTFHEPCTDVGKTDAVLVSSHCLAIRPLKRGIVQCHSHLFNQNFNLHRFYFEGFDGQMYVDVEMERKPPINATMKLNYLRNKTEFWTNDFFPFHCEAHSFFYADGIQWFFKYENGTVQPVSKYATVIVELEEQDKFNPESNVLLYFEDTTLQQVICSAPLLHSEAMDSVSMNVSVSEPQIPIITYLETVTILEEEEFDQTVSCKADGFPTPEIIWTRFGEKIKPPLKITAGNILVFPYYSENFLGEYICTAKNAAGYVSTSFKVERLSDTNDKSLLNNSLMACGITTAFIIAVIFAYYFGTKKIRKQKELKEIICMVEGVKYKKSGNSNNEITDPVYLPFKKNYEMKKDDFTIRWTKRLGEGEYGVVYQGEMNKVEGPIAIKMLKKGAKVEHLKALASELKILMFIGSHENLVALLGAYKQQLEQGILYIAVEFCGLGSLESYLRFNKHLFLKCPHVRYLIGDCEDRKKLIGEISRKFAVLHSLETLLKWCKQITCGMEYLGSKYVIHSDLATRNVLITAEGNAKITDFGLSRRMYNYTEYIKTADDDPLPWQWLAPESILYQQYSSKSDVWAFGITLWEIFSFGETPYPTFSYTQEFIDQLQRGTRNKKPKYAPSALYKTMGKCWKFDPNERPNFTTLKNILEDMIQNQRWLADAELDTNNNQESQDVQILVELNENVSKDIRCMQLPFISEGDYVSFSSILPA